MTIYRLQRFFRLHEAARLFVEPIFYNVNNLLKCRLNNDTHVTSLAYMGTKAARTVLPKKPKTVYSMFVEDVYPVIKKNQPDLSFGELSKLASQQWKDLPEDKKEEYKRKYAASREEYNSLVSSLTPEQLQEVETEKETNKKQKEKKVLKKTRQENEKPGKARSAFNIYASEQGVPEDGGKTVAERFVLLRKQFASIALSERKRLDEIAAKEAAQYQVNMRLWSERMVKEGKQNLVPAVWLKRIDSSQPSSESDDSEDEGETKKKVK